VAVVLVVGYLVTAWIYASVALSGRITDGAIPVIGGVVEEPVTLTNGDVDLAAGFFANPIDGSCAVVMIHGIDADRSHVLEYAPIYWDLGCSLFAFDHRDHGRSDAADRTYGFHESADAQFAIEWVLRRTGLAPGQVGLHGVSFGAATSLEVLDRRDDLAFIVADSPYRSMAAIVSNSAADKLPFIEPAVRPFAFFLIERRAGIEIGKVDTADAVAGKATPILLMHTAGDTVVPVEHSARVAEANQAIERHVIRADGVHIHAYGVHTAKYTSIVHEFLGRVAPQIVP
jgi:pimeloyl-ACP methyl ester carboxylesterase